MYFPHCTGRKIHTLKTKLSSPSWNWATVTIYIEHLRNTDNTSSRTFYATTESATIQIIWFFNKTLSSSCILASFSLWNGRYKQLKFVKMFANRTGCLQLSTRVKKSKLCWNEILTNLHKTLYRPTKFFHERITIIIMFINIPLSTNRFLQLWKRSWFSILGSSSNKFIFNPYFTKWHGRMSPTTINCGPDAQHQSSVYSHFYLLRFFYYYLRVSHFRHCIT